MTNRLLIGLCAAIPLAACNPPPTDADMGRDMPEVAPTFASDPLPSPETEGARWVATSEMRIVYGIPGEPALMALECIDPGKDAAKMRITRISPADEGAGALMALIGNEAIGRIEVDATEIGGRFLWQGDVGARDERLDPFIGEEELTATVPGGGMVTINPDPRPTELLAVCRGTPIESDVEATSPPPLPDP
jgi:hypothetical protein